MLKEHLLTAFRSLTKQRGYSLINAAGLATGLATTMLILLWINHELSYDQFHTNHDRICKVMVNLSPPSNGIQTYEAVPVPMAEALKAEIPGVEKATRFSWGEKLLFSYEEKNIPEQGRAVDPDFLNIFSFPLIKGDQATVEDLPILGQSKLENQAVFSSFFTRITTSSGAVRGCG